MPKPQTVLRTFGVATAAFASALLLFGAAGSAADAIKLIATVPIPPTATNTTAGKLFSGDISFFDNANQVDYFADRSNKVVDEFDELGGTVNQIAPNNGFGPFVGFVPCPFPAAANDCAGPDGVAVANGTVGAGQWLLVTDGNSRVISIDVFTGLTEGEVFTSPGDPRRADELAFDPLHGVALVINNADEPPFATLVGLNPTTGQLTGDGNLFLDAAHGVDATNGAEQPVWDPTTRKFFLSIPEVGGVASHGAVVRIDPVSLTIEAVYEVDFCSPAGLALGPNDELLVGCNTVFDTAGGKWSATDPNSAAPQLVIIDAATGNILAHVTGANVGDEVWFNKGDNNYYTAGSGGPLAPLDVTGATLTAQGPAVLGAIDASSRALLQLVPTFNVPAGPGHPAGTAHSVAASAVTNRVYVPLAANNAFPNCLTGCFAVYSR